MARWQITTRDLLVSTALLAGGVYISTLNSPLVLLGFLPGSYLVAASLRQSVRRTWEDLIRRVVLCALAGGVSVFLVVGSYLLIEGNQFPMWLVALSTMLCAMWGTGLGGIYGAVETMVLWSIVGGRSSRGE
jgi:hypothetical protein